MPIVVFSRVSHFTSEERQCLDFCSNRVKENGVHDFVYLHTPAEQESLVLFIAASMKGKGRGEKPGLE